MRIFKKIILYFLPQNQIIKTDLVPMEEIDEIVCFSNTAIGDTLFNTPVFRSLKKHYPNKKLIVMLNPNNYKLFENNPYIDEIILYSGKTKHFFKALKKLKQINPKLVLILHSNDPQATPLAVLSGAKYVIKLPNDKNEFTKWHSNNIISKNKNEHVIQRRLKELEFIGIYEHNCRMELFLDKIWKDKINKFFENIKYSKLIGFQIGASVISKMWFNERWIELGKRILEIYPEIKIVLTGAPNEIFLTNEVEKGINNNKVLNLAGKFSLEEATALISKLDLLITPDTGPFHIAVALKIPTISFSVWTDEQEYGACYDKEIHLHIKKPITCENCLERKCKNPECMKQIEVDEILQKVKEYEIFN